jgi:hypothetical protein
MNMKEKRKPIALLAGLLMSCFLAATAVAHHSFAIFDFETKIEFEGVVDSIKFRNPHIEMTIKVTDASGSESIVHFIEGAPANMLVRNGVTPDKVKVGSKVFTIGSPLIEDKNKFFLRAIRTEDGTEYGI